MIINRDNYERVFLLYVDNELSAADKIIVEEFLTANEDLREEMKVLQSAVLPDEDLVFEPKTRLYKNATPVESVQESLLLLLDNELTGSSKDALIQQINEDLQIREEWAVLQKVLLEKKDTVVFEDKKSLYRHTERVIPFRLRKAAAAVFIGLVILAGITLYNDNKVNNSVAVETKPTTSTFASAAKNQLVSPVIENKDLSVIDDKIKQPRERSNRTAASESKDTTFLVNKEMVKMPDALSEQKEDSQKQGNLVRRENVAEKETLLPGNPNNDFVIKESPVQGELTNILINDSDVGKSEKSFARLAVNEEGPDRFLNMEEEKITRSKLGGLFRQVKRIVERNTKINISNGVRIGGFEIAIK